MRKAEKPKFSFPSGKFYLNFPVAGIMGIPRSGKTTLGNLLATNRSIEYCDEPWLLGALPSLVRFGILDKDIGKDMYVAYLHELMNGVVLLRNTNFRPYDESSIWTKKTDKEILSRLTSLHSRSDVKNFVAKNKPLFLMTLSESAFLNFASLFDFLPDFKIIHVVRRGLDVAHQIAEKGHFSDRQLLEPPHARLYYPTRYKGKTFYVPCWVAERDQARFLSYSNYERSLFFWCVLMETMLLSLQKTKSRKRVKTVKFEEFVKSPGETLREVSAFLGVKPVSSSMTKTALSQLRGYRNVGRAVPPLPQDLLARTWKLYKYFGYEWN